MPTASAPSLSGNTNLPAPPKPGAPSLSKHSAGGPALHTGAAPAPIDLDLTSTVPPVPNVAKLPPLVYFESSITSSPLESLAWPVA